MVFYGNKYHYADALLSLSDVGLIHTAYFSAAVAVAVHGVHTVDWTH